MPTPIPFTDCLGLLDLMLTSDERGRSFTIRDVQCSVAEVRGDAYLEAATPDFGLTVMFQQWYVGGHGLQVHIIIVGDHMACLQWLPIDRSEKRAIIERLPLDRGEKTLLTLAV